MIKSTSWGYRELDDTIGKLSPSRLYVVGGRPSNGKTTLLLNVLNAIYGECSTHPRKVLCFWSELAPDAMFTLWAALRLGLNEDHVLMGEWEELPDEAELAINTLAWQLQEPLNDRNWITFKEAHRPRTEILSLITDYQPDIVIFDYIQKSKPEKYENRFAAVANMATALQEVAVHHKCTVLIGSQIKRRGDRVFDKYRAPDLEDMKLAGEIEEAADVVLGTFRLLKPGMTRKDEEAVRAGERALAEFAVRNTMAIRVLKHRYRGSVADELLKLQLEGKRLYGRYTTRDEGKAVLKTFEHGDAWEGPDAV